jgi:hypothetical protein
MKMLIRAAQAAQPFDTAPAAGHSHRMDIRIQCLCIDTGDPAKIASFWQSALGWRRTLESDDEVVLEPPEGSPEDGVAPDLLFLRVPEEKVVKNRLHLDLRPVAALNTFRTSGSGYFLEQATRPQTIGYALLDSPVALAAWMLDHDTDSYHKISRAFTGGQPAGNLTRDHILDNITLYWLTGTGASAARSYWEGGRAAARAAGQAPVQVTLPVSFTMFPGEIFRAPRSWVEKLYPHVIYFNEVARGGHFAAWEEPQLFSEEIRAGFRPLR